MLPNTSSSWSFFLHEDLLKKFIFHLTMLIHLEFYNQHRSLLVPSASLTAACELSATKSGTHLLTSVSMDSSIIHLPLSFAFASFLLMYTKVSAAVSSTETPAVLTSGLAVLISAPVATAKVKHVNEEAQLHVKVDGKRVVISEASIRSDLRFGDEGGIACLPNEAIFEQLTLMGSTIAYAVICLATNQQFNFSKYIFESMVKNLDSATKFSMFPRFIQVFLNNQLEEMANHTRIYVPPFHTKKVFANMKRQGKDFSGRVTPLFPTMLVQAQQEVDEGTKILTDTQQTPTIIQPTTFQLQRKHKTKKPMKKDIELPQTSAPTEVVADKAVYEEMYDSVEGLPLLLLA
nr:hypothetical protein [Tanacetum cinerariifolium]